MSEQGGQPQTGGGRREDAPVPSGAPQDEQHLEHDQQQQQNQSPRDHESQPAPAEDGRQDVRRHTEEPEYGQVKEPEYGALASQFPANYDPYVYGHPKVDDQPQSNEVEGTATQADQAKQQFPQQPNRAAPAARTDANSASNAQGPATGQPGYRPRMFNGVDLNNPNQNPLFGHWDMYAVFALVFALFVVPVIPAVVGGISMWRTRMFNMRGFWLGVAAVVINIATTLLSLWLMSQGITTQDVYNWLVNVTIGGSGFSGSTVSA